MAGSLLPQPKQIFQDSAWNPGVAYKIYTYEAGTLTEKATYQDSAQTQANTNPVIANARGEVVMYGTGTYRVILKDSLENTIWDRDNVDCGVDSISVTFDGVSLVNFIKSKVGYIVSSIELLRAVDKTKYNHANVSGYYAAGDGGGGIYYYDSSDTTTADNGGTVIVATDGARWKLAQKDVLSPKQFGAKGDGATDDFSAFSAWAAATVLGGIRWHIPKGDYVLNGASAITLKTSGVCDGRLLIPKANQTCRIEITRDAEGAVLNTTGWASLTRGKTEANALNAVGKNLFLLSTEVLIERIGSGGSPYRKQEFIRCPLPAGSFSTALVCTYTSLANLTVTAYEPSHPITVAGLNVLRTGASGGVESNRGSIVVTRDNVTLESPTVINAGPSSPIPVAIEVSYCADVVVNNPQVRGYNYSGLGYGIIAGTTIGLTVNAANIQDCRHAFTAAYDTDTVLNGGSYSREIDSHWTNRFTANDVNVYAAAGSSAFEFAGYDVTLNNPVAVNGRSLFGIRTDTPHLGGKVVIKNPRVFTRGETGYYYVFGFSSPEGMGDIAITYTNKPTLPDTVVMEDVTVNSDTATIYGAFLGWFKKAHTNWGSVVLRGNCQFSAPTIGIFAYKDATYQEDRAAKLIVDGQIDFGATGTAVYITALDSNATRNFDVRVSRILRGSLRYSAYGVNTVYVSDSTIGNVTNDDGTEVAVNTIYLFNKCVMGGGAVSSTFTNIAFMGCTFTGNYTSFPAASAVTMVGNIRAGTTGLPADIRANVVSPFS